MNPPDPTSHSRAVRSWIWAALSAAFIWALGTEYLSMESTSRFLGQLIQWLLPNVSQVDSELVQFYVRKTAHVAEYAVLAVLILRALSAGRRPAIIRPALAALGLATAFAAADETRQSLSAVRLGSVWDVALDGFGAAAGIVLLLLCTRVWKRRGLVDWAPGISKTVSAEDTHTGAAE